MFVSAVIVGAGHAGLAMSHRLTERSIDHVVLTVADVQRTLDFYERALGMTPVAFGEGRRALAFGDQKLNLHQAGREFERAASLTRNARERELLLHRAAVCARGSS